MPVLEVNSMAPGKLSEEVDSTVTPGPAPLAVAKVGDTSAAEADTPTQMVRIRATSIRCRTFISLRTAFLEDKFAFFMVQTLL